MSTRLAIQLISPQVISGMKVEDALQASVDLGVLPSSLQETVISAIRATTMGNEVDRWLTISKIKPSASARMKFLASIQ